MENALEAPVITSNVEPDYPLTGAVGFIECNAQGKPKPRIRWYRHGKRVRRVSRRYQKNTDTGALRIFRAQLSDSGEYKCVAKNRLGQASKTFVLTVVQDPIVRITPQPPVVVKEGINLDVVCRSYAYPTPSYSWITSNNLRLNNGTRGSDMIRYKTAASRYRVMDTVFNDTHSQSVLSISPVTHHDYGLFVCYSGNKGGTVRSEIMMDVQFAPKSADEVPGGRKKVKYYHSDFAPPFTLSCAATGNELPTIQWYYRGHLLNTSHCDVVRNPPEIRSFACTVNKNTMGLYQCYAENSHGRVLIQEFDVAPMYVPPPATLYIDQSHANRVKVTAPLGVPDTPDPSYVVVTYRLLVKGKPSPRPQDVYETTADLDKRGEVNVVLPGLKEHASYLVSVASKNEVGLGPDETVTIHTGDSLSVIDDLVTLMGFTGNAQLLEPPIQTYPHADTTYVGEVHNQENNNSDGRLSNEKHSNQSAELLTKDGVEESDSSTLIDGASTNQDEHSEITEGKAYFVVGRDGASSLKKCSSKVIIVFVSSLVSIKILLNSSFL
ncbi:neural cell adhesion molecule 1 [Elysia marginata]|uniref:Neural cell adhesion molecule 1 n=1 Tax=Elysia marginata TaxID=1093978 RepID=A0AAV4F236_9GAST|nr:neural cell adhesion molecule 1 [Elysia marginata]